jgi:hypothetical protein
MGVGPVEDRLAPEQALVGVGGFACLEDLTAEAECRGRPPGQIGAAQGLSAAGLSALRTMLAAGVRISVVNLLALDYGTPQPGANMGAEAIRALRAAHEQLSATDRQLSRWSSLGVTVMVGVNDSSGEVLTLSDARTVARFARAHALGLTSIWSLARDNPCEGSPTVAQPTCDGVGQPPYAFSRVFGANSRTGRLPRRAVDTS